MDLQVEGRNSLVSELAEVAAQERAMLDECEALLATTAAMQVRAIRNIVIALEKINLYAWQFIYHDRLYINILHNPFKFFIFRVLAKEMCFSLLIGGRK